jgi:hypothetical protein
MELNRQSHVVMYNIKFPQGIVLDEGLILFVKVSNVEEINNGDNNWFFIL